MTRRDVKKGSDVPLCLQKKDVKGKETNFVKACFHFEHENAWKNNADNASTDQECQTMIAEQVMPRATAASE